MQLKPETRLQELADTYPWLLEKAASIDDRLKIVNTFVGRQLIKRSTIADASRLSGFPAEKIIAELKKLIENPAAHDE